MDGERLNLDTGANGLRRLFRVEIKLFELRSLVADQTGGELVVLAGLHVCFDGPVFACLEGFDLEFAFADQAQCDRLHPAGRATAREFAPQNGGECETDEIVESTARQIGIDKLMVQLARVFHRGENRTLGNGVEDHAFNWFIAERLLFLQYFQHVPGDGLTFAIRVSGEDQFVGTFYGAGNVVQAFLRLCVGVPGHGEVFIRQNRSIFRREIAHMAV